MPSSTEWTTFFNSTLAAVVVAARAFAFARWFGSARPAFVCEPGGLSVFRQGGEKHPAVTLLGDPANSKVSALGSDLPETWHLDAVSNWTCSAFSEPVCLWLLRCRPG